MGAQHLEESFTVHLGSQMKHTHNIRIMTGKLIDMCRPIPADESDESQAQRLMLSISLYSQRLSAVVLLVDGRISRLANHVSAIDQMMLTYSSTAIRELKTNSRACAKRYIRA